jgi:hypothetical protein
LQFSEEQRVYRKNKKKTFQLTRILAGAAAAATFSLLLLLLLLCMAFSYAQTIRANWQTVNENTRSDLRIFEYYIFRPRISSGNHGSLVQQFAGSLVCVLCAVCWLH